jgi:hypothetical protein
MREQNPVGQFLYRVHDSPVDVYSAHMYSYCNETETYCYQYRVLSVTDCGAWIEYDKKKKFVLLDARKKYACESIALAKVAFVKRKDRQVRIMEAQIVRIKNAVTFINKAKYHKFSLQETRDFE